METHQFAPVVHDGGPVRDDLRAAIRPCWYVPVAALHGARLRPQGRTTWTYPQLTAGFELLTAHFTVYPGRVDSCLVDDQHVRSQAGGFYGGWITDDVVGPFKGDYGTVGW